MCKKKEISKVCWPYKHFLPLSPDKMLTVTPMGARVTPSASTWASFQELWLQPVNKVLFRPVGFISHKQHLVEGGGAMLQPFYGPSSC